MKPTIYFTVAALGLCLNSPAFAAQPNLKLRQAQIAEMCRDRNTRLIMIKELMKSNKGKAEMAEMLDHDATFRSYYETHSVNPG